MYKILAHLLGKGGGYEIQIKHYVPKFKGENCICNLVQILKLSVRSVFEIFSSDFFQIKRESYNLTKCQNFYCPIFKIYNGKIFKKGPKRVKRYECTELSSGKTYLFQPNAKVSFLIADNAGS